MNIVANIEKNSSHTISNAFKIKYALEVTDFETKNGYGLTAKVNGKKYNLGNEKFLTKLKIKNTHQQDYEDLVQNGSSIIFVIEEEKVIGLIGVKDIVRDSVKKTIKEMKDKHLEVIMLTGDNETTAGSSPVVRLDQDHRHLRCRRTGVGAPVHHDGDARHQRAEL